MSIYIYYIYMYEYTVYFTTINLLNICIYQNLSSILIKYNAKLVEKKKKVLPTNNLSISIYLHLHLQKSSFIF